MESLGITINVGEDRALADAVYSLLGMIGFKQYGSYYPTKISPWIYTNDLGDVMKCSFKADNDKEITLPQLRDLVVLKRNDRKDRTHTDQDNWSWFISSNGTGYVFGAGNANGLHQWDESSLNMVDLKPIEKTEMKEPKQAEFLVKTDGGYVLQVLDENAGGADVMRVPDGAEALIKIITGTCTGNSYFYKFHPVPVNWRKGEWKTIHELYSSVDEFIKEGDEVLWQRETPNDQVTSAEEYQHPENLPFVDSKIDIDVENFPEFKPFNNGPVEHDSTAFTNLGIEYPIKKEIKTDFPLNRGDVNYRVAKAFNEIRGTDLTEDDLDYLRKLIDLTVSHYGERK